MPADSTRKKVRTIDCVYRCSTLRERKEAGWLRKQIRRTEEGRNHAPEQEQLKH